MPSISKGEQLPLAGVTVLVTRAEQQTRELSETLKKWGATVIPCPTIQVTAPQDSSHLDTVLERLHEANWLLLTSVNGVHRLMERWRHLFPNKTIPSTIRICAVGPKTAQALTSYGLPINAMPSIYTGEGVVATLKPLLAAGDIIVFPKAAAARDVIPENLRAEGIIVWDPIAYQTVPPPEIPAETKRMLATTPLQAAVFTSPSTVRNLALMLGSTEQMLSLLKKATVFSIGPITTVACRSLGLTTIIEAPHATADDLAKSILRTYSGS